MSVEKQLSDGTVEKFQSPRSGKFVSNNKLRNKELLSQPNVKFQSPRSGKFVSNANKRLEPCGARMFQSPRSGKFVSNKVVRLSFDLLHKESFNPLDRGNLYLIRGE